MSPTPEEEKKTTEDDQTPVDEGQNKDSKTDETVSPSTKEEVVDAYLDLYYSTKGALSALFSNVLNLNPIKKSARQYLLSDGKEELELDDKLGINIAKQKNPRLEKLKNMIKNADTETINGYLTRLENGEDITKEPLPTEKTPESAPDKSATDQTAKNAPTGGTPNAVPTTVVGAAVVAEAVIAGHNYVRPLGEKASLRSKFGRRKHPITGLPDNHRGIDLALPEGTIVRSMTDGKVTANKETKLGGHEIHVTGSDGKEYCYLHLQEKSPLAEGTTVPLGQELGKVGESGSATGPHLHFAVKENTKFIDPIKCFPTIFDKDYITNPEAIT